MLHRKANMNSIQGLDEYGVAIETVAVYPESGTGSLLALIYCTLGLTGEAGEFAEKVKKIMRDNDGVISNEQRTALVQELGDVLWYVTRAASELGESLSRVATANMEKLLDRKARGVLGGSGDTR